MNKKYKNCLFRSKILLIFILTAPKFICQDIANYTNNGGFEKYWISLIYTIPYYWGATDTAKPFLELLTPPKVPSNNYGFQLPRNGNNYSIILQYCPTCQVNKRVYPRNRLKGTLNANITYCVTFYVALSNQSTQGIDALGAYFGDSSLDTITKCNDPVTYLVPQITNPIQNIITDTLNWTAITGTFIANGTEKYMVIGNFKSDANTNTTLTNTLNLPANFSDYYLDDVSVIDIDLPANAGPDKRCIPGDSVFIGREPDVGIDEACTWFEWPNMAIPIATVAGLYVKPVTTTTYVVRQQLWCSGVKFDTVVVYQDAVGLEKLKIINEELRISPNPADGVVVLSIPNGQLSNYFQRVQILDAQMRMIKEFLITDAEATLTINTADLTNGIYLLRLLDKDQQFALTKKLSVQR